MDASSLKARCAVRGLDLLVVREGVGGIYFGVPRMGPSRSIPMRSVRSTRWSTTTSGDSGGSSGVGFEMALMFAGRSWLSVDKENVLDNQPPVAKGGRRGGEGFPGRRGLSHVLVDNAAMQLIRDPLQFDVIVTGNMFGDILSDAASMLTGSIGMLGSANLNEKGFGVFEPVHGTAPDIAGQDKANPHSGHHVGGDALPLYAQAGRISPRRSRRRWRRRWRRGFATPDIHTPGTELVGCARDGRVREEACRGLVMKKLRVAVAGRDGRRRAGDASGF